jgi:hypothetical protein
MLAYYEVFITPEISAWFLSVNFRVSCIVTSYRWMLEMMIQMTCL